MGLDRDSEVVCSLGGGVIGLFLFSSGVDGGVPSYTGLSGLVGDFFVHDCIFDFSVDWGGDGAYFLGDGCPEGLKAAIIEDLTGET